jgi:hypothetical protein
MPAGEWKPCNPSNRILPGPAADGDGGVEGARQGATKLLGRVQRGPSHDALGGKTPAEVYRDSERRSLDPLVPSYPPERKTRVVSKAGTISVTDDVVFVSTGLAGEVVGLKQQGILRWRAHFFGIGLGMDRDRPPRERTDTR